RSTRRVRPAGMAGAPSARLPRREPAGGAASSRHLRVPAVSSLDDFVPDPNKRDPLELELGPDGGEFSGYRTEQDIDANPDAFREFYKLTGLDPDEWPLEGGSLRVSMWQQSKRLSNGDRDLVWLR